MYFGCFTIKCCQIQKFYSAFIQTDYFCKGIWQKDLLFCVDIQQNCSFGDEAQPDIFPEEETTSKASATSTVKPFRLRVALRSAPSTQQSTDDEDSEAEERTTHKKGVKRTGQRNRTKERHVKFEDGEAAAARPASTEDHGSDSADDASDTFLARREQNIKANKAMVNQTQHHIQSLKCDKLM